MKESILDDGFVVHKENGSKPIFRPSRKGIFYSDKTNAVVTVLST